jgi:hypothetical protein
MGDDSLALASECQEHVLISEVCGIAWLQMTLLLGDEAPGFVQLNAGDVQTAHHSIVERAAAIADTHSKTHDRIAVNASQPFNRSD